MEWPMGLIPITAKELKDLQDKAERLIIYERQYGNMIEHAIELENKLKAIKDVLKIPECVNADETPDIILGFEEQFYLKKILEAEESNLKPDCYGSYGSEECPIDGCTLKEPCDTEETKSFEKARRALKEEAEG